MSVPRYKLYRDEAADCYCDMAESGRGGYVEFDEYEALRRELTEAQETAKADRLVVEEAYCNEKAAKAALAEARGLLREARDAMGGKRELDGMREQIDAFLAGEKPRATYQGDPRFSCVYCCDTGCQYCAGEKL